MNFYRNYKNILKNIEAETDSKINSILETLDKKGLDELKELIQQRRSLISTEPAYKNEAVTISTYILSFGAAGTGLTIAFWEKLSELPSQLLFFIEFLGFFYFNLVIVSFIVLVYFLLIIRFRYPFLCLRQIGNTAPYFYYKTISPDTPRGVFQFGKQRLKGIQNYASDFEKFVRYFVDNTISEKKENSNEHKSYSELQRQRKIVRDDIQQYFLLVSYQGYVNQFEVSLTNKFICGLFASFFATVIIMSIQYMI